ncbi:MULTISPECIES: chemotaxis protein CheW [Cellvibrio]|jgi:chemosensory pili system protein ChpC|uniref:Chemosensory pili system protein ChpC n=1 Tax=Cellvibrio fibrivorans TaxID=126350 RepID=A0ABU1UUG1_9GAMM|nr:chemotaxis protein CheW [Cellvibrio fibrivorans]MDR7088833.1 chemosensory pili system protein ChpC [Cellvibrio fibrivorans]
MRAPQRIEKKVQEVASLLIPIQGRLLLAPNVTVAEIVPVSQVIPVEDAPAWYLGNCSWREQTIPLLSFEVMNGEDKPGVASRSRFAVLNTTGVNESLPFIAILTQGLPRLARVTEEEITEREDADNKPFELMHVSWAGEEAVIPHVEAMERAFLDYLHLDN